MTIRVTIRVTVRDCIEAVAEVDRVSVSDILSRSRRATIFKSRAAVYRLAHKFGHSWAKIGRVMDRDPSTVRQMALKHTQ